MATIYNGRDNPIKLLLRRGSTPFNISGYTKFEIKINGTTFDSITHPTYFEADANRLGLLVLRLGQAGISPGKYDAEIIYYDTSNPNGITFGTFNLEVI